MVFRMLAISVQVVMTRLTLMVMVRLTTVMPAPTILTTISMAMGSAVMSTVVPTAITTWMPTVTEFRMAVIPMPTPACRRRPFMSRPAATQVSTW
ncbi:MAG: hypothetical protein C0622_07775 [Desulfuromonas sp.]|nr:MAG: hypothetical protein C0622_07775 [Desulfuromonas sp.]